MACRVMPRHSLSVYIFVATGVMGQRVFKNIKGFIVCFLVPFMAGAALGYIPEIINAGFYFKDDAQNQYMPVFYNIGRCLRHAELPLLSLTNWFGGNFLVEHQFALLNPVSLLLYAVLPSFFKLSDGAAFLACFYYGILFSGCLFLARSYRIPLGGAFVVALAFSVNNFIAYWYALSWMPAFFGIAWVVWAWAFMIRCSHSRCDWVLAIVFSYLTITAGFPHVSIFWFLVAGLLCLHKIYTRDRSGLLDLLFVTIITLCLCLPTLIPLFSAGGLVARPNEFSNSGIFVPDLRDVLTLSAPMHRSLMMVMSNQPTDTTMPFFFCAWFVVPLLPFLRWKMAGSDRETMFLLILLGLVLLLVLGPERTGPVKWPFRYIPFFHLTLLLFVFRSLDENMASYRKVSLITLSFLLTGISFFMSWQKDALHFDPLMPVLIPFFLILAIIAARKEPAFLYLVLASTTFFLFLETRVLFPSNIFFTALGMDRQGTSPQVNPLPSSYTIYLGTRGDLQDPARLKEFQTGNMPLELGTPAINGYSPLWHRSLMRLLCMDTVGMVCPDAIDKLFSVEPETNSPLVDLFKINKIIIMKEKYLSRMEPYLTGWKMVSNDHYTMTYTRNLPHPDLPGTVAWIPDTLTILAEGQSVPTKESFRVMPHNSDAPVIFSRLWWSGYHAQLNGMDLVVKPLMGVFVETKLPASDAVQELTLSYTPPFWVPGWCLALAALSAGFMRVLRKSSNQKD